MMNEKYEAIIDLPHPVSERRAKMPTAQRAAQFAPFAALTGYDALLAETARRTEGETLLDEEEKAVIDRQLRHLKAHLEDAPPVAVKVFCPDDRKGGGSYRTIHSSVVKIDEYRQIMQLKNGQIVHFRNIIQLLML